MDESDKIAEWIGFAVNYPNIILGILIGSVLTFFFFHKGWITLPSIVRRMDELKEAHSSALLAQAKENAEIRLENDKLVFHIEMLEKAAADSADYTEFKNKLARSRLDSLLDSGTYKVLKQ